MVKEEVVFENALKRNTMVMALMRGSTSEYALAKIIDVRREAEKDEEYKQMERMIVGGGEEMEEEMKEAKDITERFEYYVHYENL